MVTPMRRKEREVTDPAQLRDILERCQVCRLAFCDGDYPYIVPMNYGFDFEDGQLTLYFHCAKVGRKLDLLAENNRVGFEIDTAHRLVTGKSACDYTMEFDSIVGSGDAFLLPADQVPYALKRLMHHYDKAAPLDFHPGVLARTAAIKVVVRELTGKGLRKGGSI